MSAALHEIIRQQAEQIEAQRRTIRELQGYAPARSDLTRAQAAILSQLNRHRWATKEELAEATGIAGPTIESQVSKMRKAGIAIESKRFLGYRLADRQERNG